MKKPGAIKYSILTLALVSGTVILYALVGIIPSEGFNPSDDGVILAQSYRILQGQVPHLDFISIRPAGSAMLHIIHFIVPLPLEISARWTVLLQYLCYSLLWAWIMIRFTRIRKYRGLVFFAILGLWGFLLNQNHYNLFPWTTIDALFWFVLALSVYMPDPTRIYFRRTWLKVGFITFFALMAALSRQTFALPALVLMANLIFNGLKSDQKIQMALGLITGGVPLYIYLFVLLKNSAFALFIQQMTGRTEIYETGIKQFGLEFWTSPMLVFFIFIMLVLLLFRISEGTGAGIVFRIFTVHIGRYIFLALFISLSYCIFLFPASLFGQAFLQFWLFVFLWIFEEVTSIVKPGQRRWFFWALLLSWTSAVSLGDNAPVFALGILNVTALGYLLFQFAERGFSLRRLTQVQAVSIILLTGLITISLGVQRKVNYRDVSAGDQQYGLKSLYPEMGSIRTNSNTYSYMKEIDSLYHELGFPRGKFVVLPNAAIIYPLLETPNPMPADWMQGPEFKGSEDILREKVRSAIQGNKIFFLIDRYDSKRMSDSLMPAVYPREVYPYLDDIFELTDEYPAESDWFRIRVSK